MFGAKIDPFEIIALDLFNCFDVFGKIRIEDIRTKLKNWTNINFEEINEKTRILCFEGFE